MTAGDLTKKIGESAGLKPKDVKARTRMRTEELQGINKAVEILSSPEARRTFQAATTTLLQISGNGDRSDAYGQLKKLATQYHSMSLASISAAVKTGGHFDKVIVMIDQMITLLRKEDQDDIAHRDRCQNGENKNKVDREDLAHDIEKEGEALERMADTEKELTKQLEKLEEDIKTTKDEMAERLEMRNEEAAEFKQALKDDVDAVALLGEAIVALSEFYKSNKLPLELVQEPEYTVDPDKAPETTWSGGEYGGRKKESTGIIAILSMLKEDLEKEMKTGREEDAAAQKKYEEDRAAMQEALDAQKASKVDTEKALAELQEKVADKEEFKAQKEGDLASAEDMQKTLEHDCAWVETHFVTRREKRKVEIDGLVEAKNILAGAGSEKEGDDIDSLDE